MKNQILLLLGCLAFAWIIACQPDQKTPAGSADDIQAVAMTKADSIKRGEHLSHIMGCHDCHTPKMMTANGPAPDFSKAMSGHQAGTVLPAITDKSMIAPGQWALFTMDLTAAVGPWGTSFAANLTPHETGTKHWTIENFGKAVREGKSKGMDNGRMLLPPMPWQNYVNLSDEDLANLWQYIQSLTPIDNLVPAPLPPA